jgi:hypothetical protein
MVSRLEDFQLKFVERKNSQLFGSNEINESISDNEFLDEMMLLLLIIMMASFNPKKTLSVILSFISLLPKIDYSFIQQILIENVIIILSYLRLS